MRTFQMGVVIGMLAATASAQTPAPQPPATATTPAQAPARGTAPTPTRGAALQTPSAIAPPAAPPPPTYTYQAGGRRDPFRSLLPPIRTASAVPAGATPPGLIEGPKDINVSDLTVRGVLQSGSTYLAMVQGPNGKTYVVHQGDSLRNGTIRSITPQGLVIVQEISDPLSTQKQREVRKLLRSFEEAK